MYKDIKIGVIIPTRGDRPELLSKCLHQLDKQTLKPDTIELVNYPPAKEDECDITWRYRIGCNRFISKKSADVVFLIEDDDYYSLDYIETMMNEWEKNKKPIIFGLGQTTYYHLGIKKWQLMDHPHRASAFCTMLTIDGIKNMKWPKDDYPFTDLELWKILKGKTTTTKEQLAIGIKGHKNGTLFGGMGHYSERFGYKNDDSNLSWLKSKIDEESFLFYEKIMEKC